MLKALDSKEDLTRVAAWLAERDIAQWLDLGLGERQASVALLEELLACERNAVWFFTDGERDVPIGLAGLTEIDRHFRTGTLWAMLGERRFAGRGHTTEACAELLTRGFRDLRLGMIKTWVVADNRASLRVADKLGFHYVGRLRRSHYIDGTPRDRLLFDMLPNEHDVRYAH